MIPTELQFLTENINTKNTKPKVGDVVFFGYNSNESFYDRFPLVLILSIKRNHDYNILGFNLHFIPPDIRAFLLQEIRDSGFEQARKTSREEIPRRYFTNSIKTYKLQNIFTPIKRFGEHELTKVINTTISITDENSEIEIVKYLDKMFIKESRG